jgi:hypothetical protein
MSNLQRITTTFANAGEFVRDPSAKQALQILANKSGVQDFDSKFNSSDLWKIFEQIERY